MARRAVTELAHCVLCGGELEARTVELYVGPPVVGGAIRICAECQAGQVVPRPSREALAALYSRDYYSEYAEGPGMAGGDGHVPPYLTRRLDSFERLVAKGRLLDLGCGIGLFVAHAKSRGWDAVGLETSRWAAQEGARRFGIFIVSEPLEIAGLPESSFDVVHANHVLEHLPDPIKTLRAALSVLRPGGILVAEVPQELRLPFATRLRRLLRRSAEGQKNFHLVFFSRRGLEVAFQRAGFTIERLDNTGHPDVLSQPLELARSGILAIERVFQRAPAFEVTARRPIHTGSQPVP